MRTNLDISEIDNIGLDEAFQNWLSTTVDIINSNCDVVEDSLNALLALASLPSISLTRCDTSATSNISFSRDFNDFMKELLDKIYELESTIDRVRR